MLDIDLEIYDSLPPKMKKFLQECEPNLYPQFSPTTLQRLESDEKYLDRMIDQMKQFITRNQS